MQNVLQIRSFHCDALMSPLLTVQQDNFKEVVEQSC